MCLVVLFDRVMGDGAAKTLGRLINKRFNFDGRRLVASRKVGLLSKHDLWCHIADPFSWELRNYFYIHREVRVLTKQCIKHFVLTTQVNAYCKRTYLLQQFEVRSHFST